MPSSLAVNAVPKGRSSVSGGSLRGGAFLTARYLLGTVIGVGNMLVLTRWIGPHSYGIFVASIGLVAFLSNLSRAGVDTYLVRQVVAPDDESCRTASTLIFAISLALVIAGGACTPLISRWYSSGEIVPPYLVMLGSIPLIGLTGVPMAMLERQLNFRSIAAIELGGQSFGLAVSAALAWRHLGVWAPVAGQVAWQSYTLVAASSAAATFPGVGFDRRTAREMLRYGLGLTASLRVWQLRTLVNPLLVGRLAGVETVAYVAIALRIAEALGVVRLAAGRMAIAAFARVQSNRREFGSLLARSMSWQVLGLGPLLCVFALTGTLALRLLGNRWAPSLAVFPFVAVGVLVNSIYNLQASALFVVGTHWAVMRSFLLHAAVLAVFTILLLPRLGILGYGWAELAACIAYIPIHRAIARTFSISYRKVAVLTVIFTALLFSPSLRRIQHASPVLPDRIGLTQNR